jgi:ribose 5-phosphate isomerase B
VRTVGAGWNTVTMRVHLGTDHAGLDLKQHLIDHLRGQGHEPIDHGAFVYDALDDYPVFCLRAAEAVVADPGSLGVVIGGSGNGEQIAANKVPGTRAALAWNPETARLAREHNDANIVSIGARQHSIDEATALVTTFLGTDFSGNPRHARRIDEVAAYEKSHDLPDPPS